MDRCFSVLQTKRKAGVYQLLNQTGLLLCQVIHRAPFSDKLSLHINNISADIEPEMRI